MTATEFVALARELAPGLPPQAALQLVAFREPTDHDSFDQNCDARAEVYQLLLQDYCAADLAFIRYLFDQEIRCAGWTDSMYDELKLCAYLLFRFGQAEDAPRIWRAKQVCFDTACGLDVQLIVGAGLETTLAHLSAIGDEESMQALRYIEGCKAAGDFDDMNSYRASIAAYFASSPGA